MELGGGRKYGDLFHTGETRGHRAGSAPGGDGAPASTSQRRDMFDRGIVMEFVAVIFQVFWLSLFSGTFLLLFAWTFRSLSFH